MDKIAQFIKDMAKLSLIGEESRDFETAAALLNVMIRRARAISVFL